MKNLPATMRQLSEALLSDALTTWSVAFRFNLNEKIVEKWIELFGHEDPRILAQAVRNVTRNADKMPTFGVMTKALGVARDDLYGTLRTESKSPCVGPECFCHQPEIRKMNLDLLAAVQGLGAVADMKNAKRKDIFLEQFKDVLSGIGK